jgi:DNA (cytosine-5)-methyltransferase 1
LSVAVGFAGGGGSSKGIKNALGYDPDVAINHDPEAIAMHRANHPNSRHFIENVWRVDPAEACPWPLDLFWLSPDCKHFSKAKGGKPVDKGIRGLAWLAIYWAKKKRPRVIMLENVEEFADWGPLLEDGKPCPLRRGLTFRRWCKQLQNLGYMVDTRELRACDYGAPTTRKRLFVIARCDGQPIVWPEPTHGPGRMPYRVAAQCIDWSLPCPSIFERKRPLAEPTLRRIARGIMRYVVNNPQPFIVPVTHAGDERVHGLDEPMRTVTGAHRGELALIAPSLIQRSWGERPGQAPRCMDIEAPLGTIVGGGIKHALVAAFLARHYGGHENDGAALSIPMHTVTAKDHHALVHAFLLKYYGTDQDPRLELPLHTLTTKHRFGLVTVAGEEYAITDIGMRMLVPRELFRAQGFPDSYIIDPIVGSKPLTKTAQVRMVGNSVCPPLAEALVRANFVEAAREEQAA